MVLDLIGVPFLEAGDNNTHFIVYLNDLEKILVDQPIALRLAKTQKVLHLATDLVVLAAVPCFFRQ